VARSAGRHGEGRADRCKHRQLVPGADTVLFGELSSYMSAHQTEF
jgi:hypothetical protein